MMDIVMTGYAGLRASKELAESEREQLIRTLSPRFLDRLQALPENMGEIPDDLAALPRVQRSKPRKLADGSVIPATVLAVPVKEGGVFEALWNLAELARVGLEVDLADIPIRQETIEVCEVVDANPYQLSSGCIMYLADHGAGCPGRVIGYTTASKGRIIKSAEGIRYLEKPRHESR